jgi:arsenite transporter
VHLYLAAIAAGDTVGLFSRNIAPTLETATNPVLAMLPFATFLDVPVIELGTAFRDWRFLSTVVAVNFVIVPIVVLGLSQFVVDNAGLFVGFLLVMLTLCVGCVIAFTGLAAVRRHDSLRPHCCWYFRRNLKLRGRASPMDHQRSNRELSGGVE